MEFAGIEFDSRTAPDIFPSFPTSNISDKPCQSPLLSLVRAFLYLIGQIISRH